MRLIKVKRRMILADRQEIVLLMWMGMVCPAELLEILALQRMPSRLFQAVMLLTQLLQLLSAELLGVVSGRRLESDRRVRGQMLMRRVQMRYLAVKLIRSVKMIVLRHLHLRHCRVPGR